MPIRVFRSPTPGRIEGQSGTRVDFLAADKASGHALGADLAIVDEAGLLPESKRDLWAALLSSVSGRNGRLWAISIKGDSPMFKELGGRASDRAVHWQEFAAWQDAALDDPKAWSAANPGLASGIKSISYMRDMARRALSSPADQASFRAHDLNLPQDPSREMICTPADWKACVVSDDDLPPRDGRCVVGFDLGGSASMTALVALWPGTGRMESMGAFPDTPGLVDRGKADGVGQLYKEMFDRGELAVYAGRVTPANEFLQDCATRLAGERIIAAGADRYRKSEVIQTLEKSNLTWPMTWRGQGASAVADGSHDVRAFQRRVLAGEISTAESLLMASAIADSRVDRDARGNPALAKGRKMGRVDSLSAAVIACGLAALYEAQPKTRWRSAGIAG